MRGDGGGWVYLTRVWVWRHGGAGRGVWWWVCPWVWVWVGVVTRGSSTCVLPRGHEKAPHGGGGQGGWPSATLPALIDGIALGSALMGGGLLGEVLVGTDAAEGGEDGGEEDEGLASGHGACVECPLIIGAWGWACGWVLCHFGHWHRWAGAVVRVYYRGLSGGR